MGRIPVITCPSTQLRGGNSRALFLLHVRTNHYCGNFFVSSIHHWNSIPEDVVTLICLLILLSSVHLQNTYPLG